MPTALERKKVRRMARLGVPQLEMVKVIRDGINPVTLRKHFRHELDQGYVGANMEVSNALFRKAKSGNVQAGIWWEQTRQGRSAKTQTQIEAGDRLSNLLKEIGERESPGEQHDIIDINQESYDSLDKLEAPDDE